MPGLLVVIPEAMGFPPGFIGLLAFAIGFPSTWLKEEEKMEVASEQF